MCRKTVNMIEEIQPTHICVAGDSYGSNTVRRSILDSYKRQRPKCSEMVKYQLANIQRLCKHIGFGYAEHTGYEADDVIHTFVRQALGRDFASIDIIGDDKDLLQLLTDKRVTIHRHYMSTLTPLRIDDPETEVIPIVNLNVLPRQIPDFLALVGDSVDNIPGCPTIGSKRAALLLKTFGCIDLLFKHLDEIERFQTKMKGKCEISSNFPTKSMTGHLRDNEAVIRRGLRLTKLYDLSQEMTVSIDDMEFDRSLFDVEQMWVQLEKCKIEISGTFAVSDVQSK